MPAKTRQLQQSNLDSCKNALSNAYARLERFKMIYEKDHPNMGEYTAQVMERVQGAFIEVSALRDSI